MSRRTTFEMTSFVRQYLTSYLIAIVMFAFSSQYLSKYYLRCLTLKMQVKAIEYNNRSYAVGQRISTSINVILDIFVLCLPDCEISSILKFFDSENLCKGHAVEKLDLRHSIANINLHESHKEHFFISDYRLRDVNILNFGSEQLAQGHVVKTGLTPFDN